MALPLLPFMLALGGMAASGYAGRNYLDNMFAEGRRERAGERFNEALAGAQTTAEAPRMDPDFMGPMPGEQQTDLAQLGQNLAAQGNEAGLGLMEREMVRQAQPDPFAVMDYQHRQDIDLLRHQALLQAAGRPQPRVINVPGLGDVPVEPIPVGSKDWRALADEATAIQGLQQGLSQITQALNEGGTTSLPSATKSRLDSVRQQMKFTLNQALKLGALDEGSVRELEQMLPDPTRWTPEFIAQEMGKVEAMQQYLNNLIGGYQRRSQFTGGLPELTRFATELEVPPGLRPVTEAELEGDSLPRLTPSTEAPELTIEEIMGNIY